MNRETAEQLRNIIREKKASGELISSHALLEPVDEISFIKKKLCEVVIDFCNAHKADMAPGVVAKFLEIDEINGTKLRSCCFFILRPMLAQSRKVLRSSLYRTRLNSTWSISNLNPNHFIVHIRK